MGRRFARRKRQRDVCRKRFETETAWSQSQDQESESAVCVAAKTKSPSRRDAVTRCSHGSVSRGSFAPCQRLAIPGDLPVYRPSSMPIDTHLSISSLSRNSIRLGSICDKIPRRLVWRKCRNSGRIKASSCHWIVPCSHGSVSRVPPRVSQRRGYTLPAGNGADDGERFFAGDDFFGQRFIRRFVGPILLAGVEAKEWPAFQCAVIADCPAQDRIFGFNGVEHRTYCYRHCDFDRHFALHLARASANEMEVRHES